jgi:hypothetical protein
MSISAIARQAQGIRAGEVIAKLAEDAYFMRVDNRVNQPPPARNRDNEATSRSADLGHNRTRAKLPAQPNRTRANAGRLLTVKIRQPSHEFTFGVGMTFVSYSLVLTPVV